MKYLGLVFLAILACLLLREGWQVTCVPMMTQDMESV
jgi:hypothetical protein